MNSRLKCHGLAWVGASGFALREPEHKDVSTGGWVPTLAAADWSPYFRGETQQDPRREFLYWVDGGDLAGLRYNKWKLLFLVQRAHGFDVWQEPFTQLRVSILVDLHAGPFERAEDEAADYSHWRIDRSIYSFLRRHLWDTGSSPSGSFLHASKFQPGSGHAETQQTTKRRQLNRFGHHSRQEEKGVYRHF